MYEVRFHGRGGQGAVTAANILAIAAFKAGKYTQSFPFFGVERRGAPVFSFNKISNKPIRSRGSVKNPDIVVVLDPKIPSILNVEEGVKEDSVIIINSRKPVKFSVKKVAYVDATGIALELGLKLAGLALVNMPMLGALIGATRLVKLESVGKAIKKRWREDIAELNYKAVEKAMEMVRIL